MFTFLDRITKRCAERIGVEPGNFVGVCLSIFAGVALMINGAIGKMLGSDMHPFLITFLRSAIIVMILFPWFTRNGYDRIRPSKHRDQFVNGVIFTSAMVGRYVQGSLKSHPVLSC